MEHLVVCLPTDVAAVVRITTSVEASPREAVATRYPIASRLLSRRPSPSRWHRDGLWGRDSAYAASVRRGFVVLPYLFARCLALEGLSRSEVVSIFWDPHPREPVEGDIQAMSVLELAAHVCDAEGFEVLSWRRPDSPLSHCLSLRWFQSHVVVSGVSPQLGQAAVLHVFCVSMAALSRPCTGAEVGARLASRACRLRVPLLAASGGGLVAVVVTTFPHDVSKCSPIALAGTIVIAWPCLVFRGLRWSGHGQTRASGGSRSVSSRYRSSVLWCQSVVAHVCMASRPCGVPGVRGGSACGPSTLWRFEVAVLAVRRRSHLVVYVVSASVSRVSSALCPTPLVSAGVVCVPRPWLVVVALYYSLPLLSSTTL
ncbi:hypothetical protein Taro_045291 [Colocasia esculenta]|uniref:Uncharacterized protein n=1 Tax=Colocasia esculenta TaxID=4460 RepID=A0A843X3Z9_COLES|nr:hypothetical protein [Colocasia esculenta]